MNTNGNCGTVAVGTALSLLAAPGYGTGRRGCDSGPDRKAP